MRHDKDTRVTVTQLNDETADKSLLNEKGRVIDFNTNGATGNTSEDPLHVVLFDNGKSDTFWYDELTPTKLKTRVKNKIKKTISNW